MSSWHEAVEKGNISKRRKRTAGKGEQKEGRRRGSIEDKKDLRVTSSFSDGLRAVLSPQKGRAIEYVIPSPH